MLTGVQPIAILRNPVSSFAVGVLLPSVIVFSPYFYGEEPYSDIAAYVGAMSLVVLGLFFLGHIRRVARLKATHWTMVTYHGAYLLLLRSFERTEGYQSTAIDKGPDGWATAPLEESEIGGLEAAARARDLRMVALGGKFVLPSNHGLFWLTTKDDDWEDNFRLLASGATAIVICPEATEGIRREISVLKERGLLSKSVFYMAPTREANSRSFVEYEKPEARADRWEEQREQYRAEGIELPEYEEQGVFFTLGDNLRAVRTAHAVIDPHYGKGIRWTPGEVRRDERMLTETGAAIFSLLPRVPGQTTRFSDVFPKLKLDRPIHEGVNWLYPPGANFWLPFLSMNGIALGLFYDAFVALLTFVPKLLGYVMLLVAVVFCIWVVVWCLRTVIRLYRENTERTGAS